MKFKKYFKIKYQDSIKHYDKLYGGFIGLKTLNKANLTANHINSCVKSIKRVIKKKNFLIIRANPFWGITRKPRDVRMGRGKGNVALKIFPSKPGSILFEFKGIDKTSAIRALKCCSLRLPTKCYIIKKDDKCTNSFKSSW